MKVKKWIAKNPGKKYLILKYDKEIKIYYLFDLDYSLTENLRISKVEEKMRFRYNGTETVYHIYLKKGAKVKYDINTKAKQRIK